MTAPNTGYDVLFPVSAGRDMSWGVRYVTDLQQFDRVRIHLLALCPRYDGIVRSFFADPEIKRFHHEDAEEALSPVRDALDRTGASYVTHVAIGTTAEVIARAAREHRCRTIVIGPEELTGLSGVLLGSLTRRVQQLVNEGPGESCAVF